MSTPPIDDLAGYRRRLRVTPSSGRVLAELEDDYHCMAVTIDHDGHVATAVEPVMDRAPWSICPGAVAVLEQTFVGIALESFASRGNKRANCTHLHDLALLAAAHAFDTAPTVFDILVSDACIVPPAVDECEHEVLPSGVLLPFQMTGMLYYKKKI